MTPTSPTPFREKHWAPYEAMRRIVAEQVRGMPRILEIGPGPVPFPPATEFVDWQAWPELAGKTVHTLDLNQDRLPFADKDFDFAYCRHTVEDLYNPVTLLREMSRVARAGYVETPSPVAECTRGVDGVRGGQQWRGYIHHRYLTWVAGDTLHVIAKAPLIEHLEFGDEHEMVELLNLGPLYWNTYFFWAGELKFRLLQHDVDFKLQSNYAELLLRAMRESVDANVALAQKHGLPH